LYTLFKGGAAVVVRKTSALVEAGILAAIAVLFTLAGNYIPVVNFIANILWPLPIILCGRRNGLRWSVLCLMVAGIIVAMILSPLTAVSEVLILGIVGLTIGECMRRQMSPARILFFGSIATLLSLALSVAVGFFLMNINVFQQLTEAVEQSTTMSMDLYKTIGMPASQMEQAQEQMSNTMKALKLLLPAAFFISAPITVFVNYWAATKILARMGDYYPPFPPFSQWQLPRSLLLPLLAILPMLFLYRDQQDSLAFRAAANVMFFLSLCFLIEALALIKWYVQTREKSKAWFTVAVFLTFFNQFFAQIAVILGAYDLIFNFRKHLSRRE
jgi:uncharacterized protein YybS (DUF2232 family)